MFLTKADADAVDALVARVEARTGVQIVTPCPELDVASQGTTVEDARANLIEALELFLESADQSEIDRRLSSEVFISPVEVAVG